MALINIEEAIRRFKQKLESGYFKSRREKANKLAKKIESKEPYSLRKEERDTKALCEFAESELFQELIAIS